MEITSNMRNEKNIIKKIAAQGYGDTEWNKKILFLPAEFCLRSVKRKFLDAMPVMMFFFLKKICERQNKNKKKKYSCRLSDSPIVVPMRQNHNGWDREKCI